MSHRKLFAFVVVTAVAAWGLTALAPRHASGDTISCRKAIVGKLFALKRVVLKRNARCLDRLNAGDVTACPDPETTLKVDAVRQKVTAKIVEECTMADLAALGFPGDCVYEAATTGVEGGCAALPVTTPTEFAACIECWKEAELKEFLAILYASHALDVCGGTLDETSPQCSDLDCTTPLPEQHDLTDQGEAYCQKGIGRAGIAYVLRRERYLEKCVLRGLGVTRADCLTVMQTSLDTAEAKKIALIQSKCGNRNPSPTPPFCCQCGPANACNATLSRDDCAITPGCVVKDGQTCNTGNNTCDPVGPDKKVTWWDSCPESDTCPGTQLTTLDDLIACVDSTAVAIVDELLCFQLRGNGGSDWPCPPDDE